MSLRFFLPRASGLAVLLLAALIPARADIQQTRQRKLPADRALLNLPPNGVGQTVQVNVGSQVDITLEAHGQVGKSIEFIVRDQPAHGTLTDLHLLSRNTASITYTQDPGDPAENDQFTYAVQARGSVVSAATAVPIQIVPLPARLTAMPAELDFGAVDVGRTSRAQVTIENTGGSPAVGELMPPSPWVVDGSPGYRLGKGEKQTFQLVFTPGSGRVFEDEVVLGNMASQRVRLVGSGIGKEIVLKAVATDANGNPITPSAVSASSSRNGSQDAAVAKQSDGSINSGHVGRPEAGPDSPAPTPYAGGGMAAVSAPYAASRDPAILNEAGVDHLESRWSDAHSLKIAWKTPDPTPKSYRVELRYLSQDSDHKLVIDWRSYAKLEVQPAARETTAILTGLPAGTRQTLRVVALDARGRAAAPSREIQVEMAQGTDWLRITPLRLMLVALATCLVLLWRRKRETQQILRSISDSRSPAESYS